MLLMSNYESKATLINFFVNLSTAARDKIFTDLYAECNLEQKAAMCAVPHRVGSSNSTPYLIRSMHYKFTDREEI